LGIHCQLPHLDQDILKRISSCTGETDPRKWWPQSRTLQREAQSLSPPGLCQGCRRSHSGWQPSHSGRSRPHSLEANLLDGSHCTTGATTDKLWHEEGQKLRATLEKRVPPWCPWEPRPPPSTLPPLPAPFSEVKLPRG
jgi:hypothetical protein